MPERLVSDLLGNHGKGNVRMNVILRIVRVNIPASKINAYDIFWVRVCSLIYSACKAHAPYYMVICGLSDCTIFVHIIS